MKTIVVLNGPNLNLLGQREPETYGHATLADVETLCETHARTLGFRVECLQSNHEGVLVDALQAAGQRVKRGEVLGVVFNPGAYTHTSVALADAIRGAEVPVVEVHISNIHAREAFRHHSFIAPVALGSVIGFGVVGYRLGIDALVARCAQA